VTQISGAYQAPGETVLVPGWPTSSSTLPSLVIAMLEDLQVTDGMSVLEIGTGRGYSAGLLCHRLGADNITSIEIDPAVAARAAAALRQAGYRPRLLTGDGLAGYPPEAPYDRIIATCSVRRIPRPWLSQAAEGAVIVTAMSGWLMGSALVRLTVTSPGTATGTFLPGTVSFMAAQAHAAPAGGLRLPLRPEAAPTEIGADVLNDWTERWIAQLAAPEAIWTRLASTAGAADMRTVLYDPHGSWAWLAQVSDGT
jgi:protein-L-isoaspartate O-methyltransferase